MKIIKYVSMGVVFAVIFITAEFFFFGMIQKSIFAFDVYIILGVGGVCIVIAFAVAKGYKRLVFGSHYCKKELGR